MIKVAVLGFGTVGSGVVELFDINRDSVKRRVPEGVEVKYILDLREFPDSPYADRVVHDFDTILQDPEIRVICETMGGREPAFTFSKKALERGISVCTSNKELVAAHGPELLRIAKENNCSYLFEASVGGGIPIIRPMNTSLAPEYITRIIGILNGTTNYMMTRMEQEDISFEDVLKDAQDRGYAERNPEADVEGHDACRKICILASLAFGKHIYPDAVHTEGISKIKAADVEYAEAWGGVIKLIGSVKKLDKDTIDIIVAPMFVPNESQLANIDDVFNGIMVRGDCTGDVVFYGKGAGKLPTASAVVADIVDSIKHLKSRKYLSWADSDNSSVLPYQESVRAMYLRGVADDKNAAYDKAKAVFGEIHVLTKDNAPANEFAFITEPMALSDFEAKKAALDGMNVESVIRIGDL